MSNYRTQQPGPTGGMNISWGNKNVKNLPMNDDGREWSNGLFDCCDDAGTCVLACFCPCVVYAKNSKRLYHLHSRGFPDPEHGGGCCSGDCMVHGAITSCCGLGWVMQMMKRGSIRSRYNIRGSGLTDCCTAFWCIPCELTQENLELQLEESSFK